MSPDEIVQRLQHAHQERREVFLVDAAGEGVRGVVRALDSHHVEVGVAGLCAERVPLRHVLRVVVLGVASVATRKALFGARGAP